MNGNQPTSLLTEGCSHRTVSKSGFHTPILQIYSMPCTFPPVYPVATDAWKVLESHLSQFWYREPSNFTVACRILMQAATEENWTLNPGSVWVVLSPLSFTENNDPDPCWCGVLQCGSTGASGAAFPLSGVWSGKIVSSRNSQKCLNTTNKIK